MSKYQTFKIETIKRNQIKKAPYNPRLIDEENKKRLKKGIKENGLVEPLIWNKRTGNLVSGHQRITILDELERNKDYELDVSVIDVSEEEEKKLNVQLNNPSMQGAFDFDALGDIMDEFGDFEDFGFSLFDVEMMSAANEKIESLLPDTVSVKATKNEIKEIKENRQSMKEKYSEEQNGDFYFVVVCKDQKEKDEILNKISVPITEQYVSSKQILRLGLKNGKNND